ncbi:uncharacterized protein PG986_011201 [Apiospora aurea]|uniref:Uncharacterized protein n=1 Tax=Apiospora aurea TaxID=335848 RepID=A0ABR1Q4G5_9PEZI
MERGFVVGIWTVQMVQSVSGFVVDYAHIVDETMLQQDLDTLSLRGDNGFMQRAIAAFALQLRSVFVHTTQEK